MSTLTIELPVQKDQTTFNVQRWTEILANPEFTKFEGRIETDRHGQVIMSPPPAFSHGGYQFEIGYLLRTLLPGGRTVTECPISTADGVRVADVAWISHGRLAAIGEKVCLTKAPEICVEILSPKNTHPEIAEKKALYFAAGAREVWFCRKGTMTFFLGINSTGESVSRVCRDFPRRVEPDRPGK
jgi:Uma2 family endonuclease